MPDPPQHPDERTPYDRESHSGIPRSVRLALIVVAVLALLIVVVMLVGGGEHGPSRHF